MSTLSQFAPFAGGGLKSFQTGYVFAGTNLGSGEDKWYYDITVSSVSTTKTIAGFEGSFGGFDYYFNVGTAGMYSRPNSSAYNGATAVAMTRLTSTTNLRMSTGAETNLVFIRGRWKLVEAN